MGLEILEHILGGLAAGLELAHVVITPKDKTIQANAIAAIQKACIHTRSFIRREGYVPNAELSDLWIDAMEKSIIAKLGDDLPEYLMIKAQYWGDPTPWLQNEASLSLVPKLNDLDQKCTILLSAMK